MTRVIVHFAKVLELYWIVIQGEQEPAIRVRQEVKDWLAVQGLSYKWLMNNPWEAFFDFEDAQQAMLFKLAWA